jgi:hypothetical protein
MACSDYETYLEFFQNEQFFDAVYCVYGDSVGVLLFPLLVWGAMGTALYIFSGSLVMPLVLSIILGGVLVVQLPAGPIQFTAAIVLFGIALGGYALVRRLEQ